MRNILILASFATLAACNSADDTAKVESMKSGSDSTVNENVTYPYDITYSSKFEIGDAKNAQTILNFWKDWDNGNLANGRNSFADTVEMYFSDGEIMKNAKDSILAAGQAFRDNFSAVKSRVDAVVPLKSTDKNEDWVCVWGMETDTHKNGKVDSFNLQETWRFNKAGKVDLVFQYKAAAAPPKK